ncbi:adenosylcobinamide amidohydrolase [Arthrobacter sp. B2I5]|uniref:hypothetical protein n=1 Tax=Arthrobacter sp. B2I5 TaxID=3042266 RepID=UPI002785673E|nr:hypothetical protein [Arthrobacter sp. B2I5]MDQ0825368.1 adenosylcobinamide amidohydrolase [Arthrobacter sp. B2I5]
MSELLRPIFTETENLEEIHRQRQIAAAYLGEISVALCTANAEYNHTINTIISLNMKLREQGVHE